MPAFYVRPKRLAALCAGLLLFSVRGQEVKAQSTAPAPTPAGKTSFDEVTARLDKGGSFYLYLSAEQWLNGLSKNVGLLKKYVLAAQPVSQPADRENLDKGFEVFTKLIQKSGLEQITGLGASTVSLGPGVNRNVVFVHHYRDRENGFLGTAFGSVPHALPALDFLPADTAMASDADMDLPQLFNAVRETVEQAGSTDMKRAFERGLRQISATAGMPVDTLLQSLGSEIGVVVTLDPAHPVELPSGPQKVTIPKPRGALLIQTKNDAIFQRVDRMFGGLPMVAKVDEPGLRMRTLPLPALPALAVRVTLAQWGNFLVIASDDQLIRDLIAAQKGGSGFKSTAEFARLTQGLPTEGNGFSVVTQVFADTVKQFQSAMLSQQPGTTPEQAEMMRQMFAMQSLGATYTVSSHVENGWLSVSKGARSLNQIVVPLVLVPVGIMAGIAMPVFTTVQERGKATKSLAQAKQIGMACKMYAADNDGKYPPTLDALVPTYVGDRKLFVSPFAPEEAIGYVLTPGLADEMPPATVMLEDKFSAIAHERVVIHLDTRGEVTKLPKP